jgi:uncharacterized repeat protein (TIGR01451 family)
MARFSYGISGILLLALVFSTGIVSAAGGDIANLSISKQVSSAAPYETGQPVTWEVKLMNNGPADATNISLAESISGYTGEINGVADLGTYDNSTRLWNISRLDDGATAYLRIDTTFDTEGDQTNNINVLDLDQTNYGDSNAKKTIHVINNAGAVIPDQPLKVNLAIRPTTLNVNSKGVFTVFVTLTGGDSPFGTNSRYHVDYSQSSTARTSRMLPADPVCRLTVPEPFLSMGSTSMWRAVTPSG